MPSHRVQTEELSLVIGDNAADGDHQAGYNGIWDLRSVHDEAPFFVPPYCGMNFEFIAPKARENPTEPKDHPTQLSIEGDEVVLHQDSTPTHAVESWMRYRPSGPAHIDWTFRYKLHDPGAFSTGVAGFFRQLYRPAREQSHLRPEPRCVRCDDVGAVLYDLPGGGERDCVGRG